MGQFTIFLVLITIVSFLLVIAIMVQNPKSGGLSSTFGGTQIGGVQKTTDFLDKSTWTLATILIALILLSSLSFSNKFSGNDSLIDDSAAPAATAPAPAPAGENTNAAPAQPQGTVPAPAEQAPN